MCLIVVKPAGVQLPKETDLEEWFWTHDDGFGLAYPNMKGGVQITKGAMSIKDMFDMLDLTVDRIGGMDEVKARSMVFHFRQATTGTVNSVNCHPFPITDDEHLIRVTDAVVPNALAHNGIVSAYSSYYNYSNPSPFTDTQQLIIKNIVPLGKKIQNKRILHMIADLTESKYALVLPDKLMLAGGFINDKDTGLLFSNNSYKWETKTTYGEYWGRQLKLDETVVHTGKTTCEECSKLTCKDCPELDTKGNGNGQCEICDSWSDHLYLDLEGEAVVCPDCYTTIYGSAPDEKMRFM